MNTQHSNHKEMADKGGGGGGQGRGGRGRREEGCNRLCFIIQSQMSSFIDRSFTPARGKNCENKNLPSAFFVFCLIRDCLFWSGEHWNTRKHHRLLPLLLRFDTCGPGKRGGGGVDGGGGTD